MSPLTTVCITSLISFLALMVFFISSFLSLLIIDGFDICSYITLLSVILSVSINISNSGLIALSWLFFSKGWCMVIVISLSSWVISARYVVLSMFFINESLSLFVSDSSIDN